MSLKFNRTFAKPASHAGKELPELTAIVARWGTEAGFLGIEGHLEARVLALVREASGGLFGNCEAERDRWLCRIEAMERELEESARKVQEWGERRNAAREWLGQIAALRGWLTQYLDNRQARSVRRRIEPELRKARLEFEFAERTRRDAAEWREMAVQCLRATYEYRKERAALVRPEKSQFAKEPSHDTHENRQFIVHRAN